MPGDASTEVQRVSYAGEELSRMHNLAHHALGSGVWVEVSACWRKRVVFSSIEGLAAMSRKSLAHLFNAEQQDRSHHELKSVDGIHGATNKWLGNRLDGNA